MTKYLIYGETSRNPIRRTKHENDAMIFASDFKNLQRYGCMTVIQESDDGRSFRWDADTKAWIAMEDSNG